MWESNRTTFNQTERTIRDEKGTCSEGRGCLVEGEWSHLYILFLVLEFRYFLSLSYPVRRSHAILELLLLFGSSNAVSQNLFPGERRMTELEISQLVPWITKFMEYYRTFNWTHPNQIINPFFLHISPRIFSLCWCIN